MRVLGISPAHDSSVAIINDGVVELYLKEERLTRKKRDQLPYKSLFQAISKSAGVIDHVVCGSPTANDQTNGVINDICYKVLGKPVISYHDDHHLCHASLAFYNSGFDKSLVFVIDRNGSVFSGAMREAETVFLASYPCEFKTLHKNYWLFNTGADADRDNINAHHILNQQEFTYNADRTMSVVRVYESATSLIGQEPLENGKTMGLSSYGKDKEFTSFFNNNRPDDYLFLNGNFVTSTFTTPLFREYIGKQTNNVFEDNYQFYADYAYQVQKQTQEAVLRMIEEWVNKTEIKNVCITGGYALNVVANEYYIKNLPHVNFYFEPLADDSGNSIGAAMHYYRELSKDCKINKLDNTFFHGYNSKVEQIGESCTIKDIAELLIQQKTVAVFNGLAESGPRALGNRSILFDSRNKEAKRLVNLVKNREWYRPFACSVLKEDFQNYFDTHGLVESDFMVASFQCKDKTIAGVTHVDNTCRVQTVDNKVNHLYELLKQFKQMTGCSVLLNTSFNLAGEPLVETQEEAIKCFENSSLDVLWFPEISSCLIKGSK